MALINQLRQELKDLAFEKKQIFDHLALVEKKIDVLSKALTVLEQKEALEQYNSKYFTYRQRARLFRVKITKHLVKKLKSESNKGWTIAELTQYLFDLEGNPCMPSEKHLDSVRKSLNKLYEKGLISRTQVSRREVYWQWK